MTFKKTSRAGLSLSLCGLLLAAFVGFVVMDAADGAARAGNTAGRAGRSDTAGRPARAPARDAKMAVLRNARPIPATPPGCSPRSRSC